MKIQLQKLSLLILWVISQSCSSKPETTESFDNLVLENTTTEKVLPDTLDQQLIISDGSRMIAFDSCIVILSDKVDSYLTLVNLRNNEISEAGMKGRGVGELIMAYSLVRSPLEGYFEVYDIGLRAIMRYNLDSCLNDPKGYIPKKIDMIRPSGMSFFSYSGKEYISLGNSRIIGQGIFNDRYRWSIYDTKDRVFNYAYEYTFDPEDQSENIFKSMAYQGSTMAMGDKVVWVCWYSPIMETYMLREDTLALVNSIQHGTVKYEATREGGGVGSALKMGNQMGFTTIDVDEDYIYALYSGKVKTKENPYSDGSSNKILIYDWEGDFVKGCKLDEEIICLTKMPNKNRLYGISTNSGELLTFEI
ncbi:BF3164 family lipoprotein [Flammeovirgaceae bacterium SG7u.111]|nr:BF3164 family lipoprotein [Flammeovirgaceae bacterium SG7u.132]WPO34836.1 BF3164 family lipoprotein [Flammeovirgaceae bacterium SG7u.111]